MKLFYECDEINLTETSTIISNAVMDFINQKYKGSGLELYVDDGVVIFFIKNQKSIVTCSIFSAKIDGIIGISISSNNIGLLNELVAFDIKDRFN